MVRGLETEWRLPVRAGNWEVVKIVIIFDLIACFESRKSNELSHLQSIDQVADSAKLFSVATFLWETADASD